MKNLKSLFQKITGQDPAPGTPVQYEENSLPISQTVDEPEDYQVSQLLKFDNRPYVSILENKNNE